MAFGKSVAICMIFETRNQINFSERSRSLYAVARPSVVCLWSVYNARTPYSGGCRFRQFFYGIWNLRHPLTFTKNFTKIVTWATRLSGELNTTGVAKYSDFRPIEGYISETVQDRK